ncbi:MAG: CDP-alcohol phosphatidyltransferase family protein [Deltaproteobacteria bacterium]|nr:CDP-alcohol phosphatidyltransferase family protein [Deltaproteobacteria bacterium]
MIALVRVRLGPSGVFSVAGLPVPLRTLLALQAAGASEVGFAGPAASAWRNVALRDGRAPRCSAFSLPPPDEAKLVVDQDLVLDTTAARGLLAVPGVFLLEGAPAAERSPFTAEECPAIPGVAAWARTPGEAALAEERLLAALRKPQDGVVSRRLNRTLSLAVTRYLCRTRLTPNALSVAILGVGLLGASLAARGTALGLGLGGVLFQAQSVLDGCDGELARLTFRGSRAGEWIDTVGDDLTNYSFFAALGLGLQRAGLGRLPLVLSCVGVSAGVLSSVIAYRYLLRIGSGDLLKYPMSLGPEPGAQDSPRDRLAELLRPLFKRDFVVFATMVAALCGPRAALVALGAFAVGAQVTLLAVLRSEWSRRGERLP